jgi:Putative zinc-finger
VPHHPDQEQLAAYQAGGVDRRERLDVEAHLAACPSCAELVASVGHARGSLALLEEPDLPPGLHDRITTAVEAEAGAGAGEAGTDATRPVMGRQRVLRGAGSGDGSRRSRHERWSGSQRSPEAIRSRGADEAESEPPGLRPAPWYRRPAAWGAAAALLLAALVVPFLNQSAGNRTTAGGDSGGAAQEAAAPTPSAAGNLPVFRVQGKVTADTVRKRLQTDPQARAALSGAATPRATDQDEGAFRSSAKTPGTGTEAPADAQPPAPGPQPSSAGQALSPKPGTEAPSASGQPSAAGAQRQPCLPAAAAAADPVTRPLAPAFFIEGTYKGRPATILVTTSTSQPGRVDLWVFPRDDCSQVLATEQVR